MIPTISKGNIGSGSVGKSKTFKGLDKVMAEQEASYIAEQNAASLATGGNPTNVSGLSASSAEVAGIMSGSIPSNVNSASEIPESGFDPAQPNTKLPLAERVRRQEEGLPLNPKAPIAGKVQNIDFGTQGQETAGEATEGFDPRERMIERANRLGITLEQNDFAINYWPNKEVGGGNQVAVAYAQQAQAAKNLEGNAQSKEEYRAARENTLKVLDAQYDPNNVTKNNLPSVLQNLDAFIPNKDGRYTIDPNFVKLMSLVTEMQVADMFFGTQDTTENTDGMLYQPDEGVLSVANPTDSALALGSKIEKWQGVQKRSEEAGGEPIRALSELDKKALGVLAFQTYQASNPDLLQARELTVDEAIKEKGNGKGTHYVLTAEGLAELEDSKSVRNELFGFSVHPRHVEPTQNSLENDLEVEKPEFRRKGAMGMIKNVVEALFNQSKVGHVVDNKRVKILMLLLQPSLLSFDKKESIYAEGFGIGKISRQKIIEKEIRNPKKPKTPEEAARFADGIINNKKRKLMNELASITENRNVVNWLTYYAQPLEARSAPNQTHLNPTTSKIARFVLRSPTPVKVVKGSQLEKNFLQMVSSTLLSGNITDPTKSYKVNLSNEGLAVPDRRVDQLNKYKNTEDQNVTAFISWGKQLKRGIGDTSKGALDGVSQAIKAGIPLNDNKRFPDMGYDAFDAVLNINPQLEKYLLGFGEDMPLAVETLIDFADYTVAMENNRPHVTVLNAYFDGKTNGIASQGLQIGNMLLSSLTGVIRSANGKYVLMEAQGRPIDVRDYMKNEILKSIRDGKSAKIIGYSKDTNELHTQIMKKMGGYRPLNKIISMVFPYGKEVEAMGDEVRDMFLDKIAEDPEFKGQVEALVALGVSEDVMMQGVLENVTSSLKEIFGEDTFKARSLMKNSAMLFAAMDLPFEIEGPMGHTIGMHASKQDMRSTVMNTVSVSGKGANRGRGAGGGKSRGLKIQASDSYRSTAAVDKSTGILAKGGTGQSAVSPTQAIDAGTVIKTFIGASWDRIKASVKSNGGRDPYVSQIYDAFKVDVASYNQVLDEVNQNWLDISLNDYNFFAEAQKSVREARAMFSEKMENVNGDTLNRLTEYTEGKDSNNEYQLKESLEYEKDYNNLFHPQETLEYAYIGQLLNGKMEDSDYGPVRRFSTLLSFAKSINPLDTKGSESAFEYNMRVHQSAADIFNKLRGRPTTFQKGNNKIQPLMKATTYKHKETGALIPTLKLLSGFKEVETMSNTDIYKTVNKLFDISSYENKMGAFISHIGKQREKIRAEIRKLKKENNGVWKIYQYYAK